MAKSKPSAINPALALVDELGALDRELSPFAAKIRRADALRRSIRDQYATADAAETILLEAQHFAVELGPRGVQTVIDVAGVFKAVGAKAFVPLANVTLADLKGAVTCDVLAKVTSLEQTGYRPIKIYERAS